MNETTSEKKPEPKKNPLKEMVKRMKSLKKLIATDVAGQPFMTRAGMANAVAEAKEQLQKLEAQYGHEVRSASLGVVLLGAPEQCARFAVIAQEEVGMLKLNALEPWRVIGERLFQTMGSRKEFGTTQLRLLNEQLRDLANGLGMANPAPLSLKNEAAGLTKDETIRFARSLALASPGPETVYRVWMDREITARAVEEEFVGKTMAVCLLGLEERDIPLLQNLFTNVLSVAVKSDVEVDKNYVLDQLKAIKTRLSSKMGK